MMLLLLFLVFTDMTQSQGTVTLSPNGTVSICQKELKVTCNVTGSILVWTNGSSTTSFSSGDTQGQYIAPFSLILQSHGNGTLVSVATVNVSESINGSVLECMNTISATSSSIRRQISFNVKHSLPISYLQVDAVLSDILLISWTGADCIQSYDVFINGTNVTTTSGMSLLYNTGGTIGSIDVLVNSVDHYGRTVGNLSTQYQFNKYNFEVEAIISNSMSLNVIIKDKFIIQQPAPFSCELTVSNLTQSSMDCLHEKLFAFTNVTEGDVYNYTVTITNVIGSAVKNDSIEIPYSPFGVCPSEIQYSLSTKILMMSSTSSVLVMEPSTRVSPSSDSNCVLPLTVDVLIGAAVMTVIYL